MAPSFSLKRTNTSSASFSSPPPSPSATGRRGEQSEARSLFSSKSLAGAFASLGQAEQSRLSSVRVTGPGVDHPISAPSTPTRSHPSLVAPSSHQPLERSRSNLPAHPAEFGPPHASPRPRPRGVSLASDGNDRRNAGWFSMNGTAHRRSSGDPDTPGLDDSAVEEEIHGAEDGQVGSGHQPSEVNDRSLRGKQRNLGYFSSFRRPSRTGMSSGSITGRSVISGPISEGTRKASKEEIMHDLFLLNGGKATEALGWAVRDSEDLPAADLAGSRNGSGSGTASSYASTSTPGSTSALHTPYDVAEDSHSDDTTPTQMISVDPMQDMGFREQILQVSPTRIGQRHNSHPTERYNPSPDAISPRNTRHRRIISDVTGVAMLGKPISPKQVQVELPPDFASGPYLDPIQDVNFAFRQKRAKRTTTGKGQLGTMDPPPPPILPVSSEAGLNSHTGAKDRARNFDDSAVAEEDEELGAQIMSARRESMLRRASASRSRDVGLRESVMDQTSMHGREVICRVLESAGGDEDEIRWEVVLRRKQEPSVPSSAKLGQTITLSGCDAVPSDIPNSATSINLSLALDKPTGTLVFVSLPVLGTGTPIRSGSTTRRFGSAPDPLDASAARPASPIHSSPRRPMFPAYVSAPALRHAIHNSPLVPLSPKSLESGFDTGIGKPSLGAPFPHSLDISSSPASPKDRTRAHRKISMQGGIFLNNPPIDRD